MSSVMVARLCSNNSFDPAFRLLDNDFDSHLSGLGARKEMYSSGHDSSDLGYGHPQGGQQQQRPQLGGRRTTYSSSSNMCVRIMNMKKR